jgi:hypothetical protein
VLIPPSALLHGLRLAPTTQVFDLESRERDSRGRVLKSALCGAHETPFSQGGARIFNCVNYVLI